MQLLLDVIVPVFLVIGFGYVAALSGLLNDAAMDVLMRFVTVFAIPCLLFLNISTLDLRASFDLAMLASYFASATAGFVAGMVGARFLFGRPWEDSVVIGFVCLFSNIAMMSLPIAERAYGTASMANNYAILAVHAPFCYLLGITVMEIVRNRGRGVAGLAGRVGVAMFRNALMIGLFLGFAVNLSGFATPMVIGDALQMMERAALPVALFALGGILSRYRPEGDFRVIAYICVISLLLQPLMAVGLGSGFGLEDGQMRAVVLSAAMAPGINGFIFASMYGRAMRVAASSVLLSTALAIVTVWFWLQVAP